ncbi:MAG TPA: type II toxin-antitoxin system HicB family antitoxin [Thermoflexia bacterium]|jgi:antitoxin HicB|nr:type II toxin-antitoxin system HicB family antitoxin [Thermoflexia bacterium]
MDKNLEYYLSLPYTIELIREPEGGWFVRVRELPGCMSVGDTPDEAVEMIQDAMCLWIQTALEDGDPIPEPRSLDDYSGKFVVRVPRSLHRDLVIQAEREGVSLNQYINTILARAVGRFDALSSPASVGQPGWPAARKKANVAT